MPFKFLPAPDDWEKALAAVKVKPDSALSKVLDESWKTGADQPAKRLALLPKILKLATDFKKSKVVVAAGANAAKVVQDLIDVIPVVRKEREKEVIELQKTGACQIDVQFNIKDWTNKSFESATGYVEFESPGLPTIRKIAKLSASGMSIDNVTLRPKGMVGLRVDTGSRSIEGSADYEFKPGQDMMRFTAVQHHKTHKTKSKSAFEAVKKFGLKGSLGVEIKVFSAGVEKSSDSEYKEVYESEVEWEIEEGLPTFKTFELRK